MKIDRMKEGSLYEIKPQTVIESNRTTGMWDINIPDFPILKGWRKWDHNESKPPFIYLGYKYEDWVYNYQNTHKIHYVLWQGAMYVMDNQFAKHVIPAWDGGGDGG